MASISANGKKGHHKFTLTVTEAKTDTAKNESTISFSFELSPVQTSWNWIGWGQSIAYSVTINGTKYSGYIPDYDGSSTVNLKSGTQTVAHNADGTKSISYSFSVTDSSQQTYTCGAASANGTFDLTTISRVTTPTFSAKSVTMDKSITITLKPASSTFKHKVDYTWAGFTYQTAGVSSGANFTSQGDTTVTFTPPIILANDLPNSTSGVCTIYCYTYNSSGTLIGSEETSITVNVPDYTPTATLTVTGNNLLSGSYVHKKSTITVKVNASTSYGALISSCSSTVDGTKYYGESFTTNTLSSGSKTVETTVTDSRGKTVKVTSPAQTVYEYATPQISSFTLERQSDNTTVIAKLKGSVSSVNSKNAKTIKVVLGDSKKELTPSAYAINESITFTGVSTDVTLKGTATITDSYISVSQDSVLPTVAVTMDFHSSGKGVAFGKVAEEEDLLDVAWRLKNSSVPSLIGGLGISIPSNSNINTVSFLNPGNYVCPSNAIAQTVTNSPTGYAFKMCVHNVTNSSADATANQWTYLVREITNYKGERWIQTVDKDTGSWAYSSWYLLLNNSNTKDRVIEEGTTSDGWEYTKWANGKIELWADKTITFPEPTNMGNYLWRSLYSLDMSSKLKSIISGTCCVQYNGMLPTFSRHSTTLTMGEVVVATSKSFTSFTTVVPIYIMGRWK